jgi:glycosyltransferase involved in cell wall biosynthesis
MNRIGADTRGTMAVAHVLRKLDGAAWGGTETHVAEMTTRLARRGWTSKVLAPGAPTEEPHQMGAAQVERYSAFCPFVGPRERRRALLSNAGNIASLDLVRRLARDRGLSLAHVHTGKRIAGAVRVAMRMTGRPYVVSVHGPVLSATDFVTSQTSQRLEGLWDLGKPLGMLLGSRRVFDDAARVVCFNDDEHRALSARIGGRAVRMDHGVDRARFERGDGRRGRGRWAALGDAPAVVVLGRLSVQKNQILALRAFAGGAPADHRLVLAGAETDPGYASALMEEARALGVGDRVHWLGNVDPVTEVPDLLRLARVVLVPSVHEAFGLAVLEAWAAGAPVIFAGTTGMADIARALSDRDAVVASYEPIAWATRLHDFLHDSARRGRAAASGALLVQRRFDWDTAATRLADLYAEVLAERSSARPREVAYGA